MTLLLSNTPAQTRRRYVSDIVDIVGYSNIRAFYAPLPGEGLKTLDAVVPGRVWTHANDPGGRIVPRGNLWSLQFNGTSDYLTTPDADDLSIGNGAFSFFAALNVTDTATVRGIVNKASVNNREWEWRIHSTDAGLAAIYDDTTNTANNFRMSDAAITQGSWVTMGVTKTSASISASNMTLYQAGASIASTAADDQGGTVDVVANLGAAAEIGRLFAGNFFNGAMATVLVLATALTATQHSLLNERVRQAGIVT